MDKQKAKLTMSIEPPTNGPFKKHSVSNKAAMRAGVKGIYTKRKEDKPEANLTLIASEAALDNLLQNPLHLRRRQNVAAALAINQSELYGANGLLWLDRSRNCLNQ